MPPLRFPALFILLAALPAALTGCAWRTAASPARAELDPNALPPLEWPARRTHDLDQLFAIAPTELATPAKFTFGEGNNQQTVDTTIAQYKVVASRMAGAGIIREIVELNSDQQPLATDIRALQFVSYEPSDLPPEQAADRGVIDWFVFEFSPERMDVYPPTDGDEPRGLAVWIQALGQTKYEEAVIEELRSRGWMVVQTSFVSFLSDGIDVAIGGEEDLEDAVETIARFADRQLSRTAYAAEGAAEYLRATHASLADAPVVVLGFSGGALATPTVVARRPDLYDAAVIVAGGANLLEISMRSAETNGGIGIAWRDDALKRSLRPALVGRYLERVHLDPYHAAPHITNIPILQLHGAFDRIVPASTGDRLHERLGEPECWTYPGGHGLVFFSLPGEAKRIANWIEHAVRKGDG